VYSETMLEPGPCPTMELSSVGCYAAMCAKNGHCQWQCNWLL